MLNIIICGTPGTGKSTLIEKIKPKLPKEFNFINLSKFALDNKCTDGYDESLETHIIDEDKLLDCLEPVLKEKNYNIIECIHGDQVDIESIHWVFVCRTDNTKLYDRLKARGYNEAKILNNVQAEIFQTIHDEALEQFGDSIISQLINDEESDIDKNVEKVVTKLNDLMKESSRT